MEDIANMMRMGQKQLDHKWVEMCMEVFSSIDQYMWILVTDWRKVDKRMTYFDSKRWKLLVDMGVVVGNMKWMEHPIDIVGELGSMMTWKPLVGKVVVPNSRRWIEHPVDKVVVVVCRMQMKHLVGMKATIEHSMDWIGNYVQRWVVVQYIEVVVDYIFNSKYLSLIVKDWCKPVVEIAANFQGPNWGLDLMGQHRW